jgi:hypothetical protein
VTLDEGITVVLMVGVGALTTAALYVGLVGMLGGFYIVRCASCNHWIFSPADRPRQSCTRCRRSALLHPLRAVRHPERGPGRGYGRHHLEESGYR